MTMHPVVSVIVPVYKVEDYLERCLDSLSKQSLENIEIIIVDDASPDRCGEICETYAAKDSRFKVIHHLKNRGLSVTRNTGISNANGDYLMFVDSDDWVHEDFCKKPYDIAVTHQADLVMFKCHCIRMNQIFTSGNTNINSSIFTEDNTSIKSGYITTEKALDLLFKDIKDYAWNKLYHKDIFKNISYPANYLYEDIGTTYKAILKAHNIYFLDMFLYYHSIREGSITFNRNKKLLHDYFEMSMHKYYGLLAWGYSIENLNVFLSIVAFRYCMEKKKEFSDSNWNYCAHSIRSNEIIPKNFTLKRKILYQLLKYSPMCFELVCTAFGKKRC